MVVALKHELRIAWRGALIDADADVSGRVRDVPGVQSDRGVDGLALTPPMAGQIDAELDNRSRDYSVLNGASPLNGYLIPGAKMRWAGTAAWDDFGRADSTTSLGLPDLGLAYTTTNAYWGISSGQAYRPTATGGAGTLACAFTDTGVADGVFQITLATVIDKAALAFRCFDSDNGWFLVADSSNNRYTLTFRSAGAETVAIVLNQVPANGDVLRAECLGQTIQCYVNNTALTVVTTATLHQTRTLAGMRIDNGAFSAQARWSAFRAFVPRQTAYLDGLPQHPEPQRKSVGIPGLGTLSHLKGRTGLSTPLYGDGTDVGGIRTDVALGALLDAAGETDTTLRLFDTGQTILQWFWLAPNEDVYAKIVSVLNSEGPGARLFEDGWGRRVFKNRLAGSTDAVSTTSRATFRDTGTEPLFQAPFVYDAGLKHVVTECSASYVQRAADVSLGVIWTLGFTVALGPNEARSYTVTPTGSDPFTAAAVPAAGTDYVCSSGSVTPTLDRTSGAVCTLTLTAGSAGATIQGPGGSTFGIQVRAKLVRSVYQTKIKNSTDMTTAIAQYGVRTYNLPTLPEINANSLLDFCNAVVGWWGRPHDSVEITVNNSTLTRVRACLSLDVNNRITVIEAQTGVNDDYLVRRVKDVMVMGGKIWRWTFAAEKAGNTRYFTIGMSTLGGTDVLGY